MGGSHHVNADDDYTGDGLPLSDTTRIFLILVHYSALPLITLCIYAFLQNYYRFQQRIYSPFLLMVALTWLLKATSFEIGNHYYVNNWQLFDPKSDLINGTFFFFNFGAQSLLALSLRKEGLSFIRKGASFLDWLAIILDPIIAILVIVNPIVYVTAGRSTAVATLSPTAAISGIFTLVRVWYNLGPNVYTQIGGIGFFVLAMCGVASNAIYMATDAEWVHLLIGGSFVSSTIPLCIAFFNVVGAAVKDEDDDEGIQLP